KWRSVPQIAVAVRRTIASVGASIFGSGTSSRRMSPTPWNTTARISIVLLSSSGIVHRAFHARGRFRAGRRVLWSSGRDGQRLPSRRMTTETRVRVEDEGAIRILTLSRPEKKNAFDVAMAAQLWGALEAAEAEPSVRAIVVTA